MHHMIILGLYLYLLNNLFCVAMGAEGPNVDVELLFEAPTVLRKTIRFVDYDWENFKHVVRQHIGTFRGTHDFYLTFLANGWREGSHHCFKPSTPIAVRGLPHFSILMNGPSEVSCAVKISFFNGTDRGEVKQGFMRIINQEGIMPSHNHEMPQVIPVDWFGKGNPWPTITPSDNMVFEVELEVVDAVSVPLERLPAAPPAPVVTAPPRDPLEGLAEQLGDLFESSELSDMVLRVEGRDLRVHSAILAAHSPVFRTMFQSGFAEKTTRVVEMKDTDFDTAQRFCRFLYTGSLDKLDEASTDEVLSLLKLAKIYDVVVLQDNLVDPLIEKLSSADARRRFVKSGTLHSSAPICRTEAVLVNQLT
eukprot:Selendium_serpulae@DN6488_c0_g1_i10.p1